MDDRLIALARSVITNVIAPLVGLGGIIYLLSNPDAPDRPTLVIACGALVGYPIAKIADRKRTEEEEPPR